MMGQTKNRFAAAMSRAAVMAAVAVAPVCLAQTIVAFGDSVTKGVRTDGSVTREQIFSTVLEERLRATHPKAKVINSGVGGNDTGQMLERLDRDILPEKPDVVLVMAGLNDAAYVSRKGEARDYPRVTVDAYRRNLKEIYERLHHAGARVILLTSNPLSEAYIYAGKGYYQDHGLNESLAPYAEAVRALARETGSCLVDVFAEWTADAKFPSLLVDGIHPNAKGHVRIAEEISSACPMVGTPLPERR